MGTDQLNMACLHLARKGRKQSAVVVELVSTSIGGVWTFWLALEDRSRTREPPAHVCTPMQTNV
jgi:hypothetical protein